MKDLISQFFWIRELAYCCKKGESAIAGRHVVKVGPGIILSGLTVPGKCQGAISVPKGECNLHVEHCNQEQTTLDSTN